MMRQLLSHSIVERTDTPTTDVVFILHGILGSGRNWRTVARALTDHQPGWKIVLVDLRNHGKSQGFSGPHSLANAANDLVNLASQTGEPSIVIGHSFGGKVALAYAALKPSGLRAAWVLDSRPGAEPPSAENEVMAVLDALADVPQPLQARQDLIPILGQWGFSQGLAQWLTTNLARSEDGFRWVFPLPAIREMISDYWTRDYWPLLATPPCPIHIVRAGRSDRWPPEVIRRFETEASEQCSLHVLEDAGHWLHVDDPEGLIRILTS